MARTKPWTVSDEFWEKVELLVPEAPSHEREAADPACQTAGRSRR
jgi:transposase